MSTTPKEVGNGAVDVDEAFRNLVLNASLADAESTNPVFELLAQHLGVDPNVAVQVKESYVGTYLHPIVQCGLDAFLAQPGRTHEIVGALCPIADPGVELTLSKLFSPASLSWPGVALGPADWEQLESGYQKTMRCLRQGIILVRDADGPAAIWIDTKWYPYKRTARNVTVIAEKAAHAGAIVNEIHKLNIDHSPYKGELFVFKTGRGGIYPPVFMPRPNDLTADQVILPPGLLDRIDQHAVGVSRVADQIVEGGQHLKRGLLLYGRPGTGKTHTIRYLVSKMPNAAVMLMPGNQLQMIGLAAREFVKYLGSPAVVVLDDVDLIAEDRSMPGLSPRASLFDLLEMLDGLHGHQDMLFVLTTNRATTIEPAVAARPGRIDEAIEVPLPDADCRRRLFALYGEGMDLQLTDEEIEQVVERTDGVTAAFTKELLRRATVVAVHNGNKANASGVVPVTGADLFAAIDQMLDPDNPMTRLLLGAEPDHEVAKLLVTNGDDK